MHPFISDSSLSCMMFQTRLDFFKENILLWAFLEGSVLHIFDTTEHPVCLFILVFDFAQSRPILQVSTCQFYTVSQFVVVVEYCSADLITNMSASFSNVSTIRELGLSTKGCPPLVYQFKSTVVDSYTCVEASRHQHFLTPTTKEASEEIRQHA